MTECPCSKSELAVCDPIPVQVAMVDGRWQTYYPINAINAQSGVAEFSIPGTTNEVIDLNNISLYIRGKIKASAAANLEDKHKIFPANNFLHSIIRHIDVSVGGQLVTRAGKDYAYKAMLMKLTQTDMPRGGQDDPQLLLEGFVMDSPAENKSIEGDDASKSGQKRQKLIAASRSFELVGAPCVDLFQCDRSLVMGADVALKFYFNDPIFFLIDNTVTAADRLTSPLLEIEGMELRVRRVQIAPSFVNAMQTELQHRDALYPFTRREILTFNIPAGTSQVTKENLFRGYLANRFFICMVSSTAYNGAIKENPFYFEHFGLKEISLAENGLYMACNPLKVDLTDGKVGVTAYRYLLESIGAVGERALTTPITYEHFCKGSTIFCFSRSPDLTHGMNHLPPQTASITLQMLFGAATAKNITVIVMAEYDSRMQISKDNNVVTDYAI